MDKAHINQPTTSFEIQWSSLVNVHKVPNIQLKAPNGPQTLSTTIMTSKIYGGGRERFLPLITNNQTIKYAQSIKYIQLNLKVITGLSYRQFSPLTRPKAIISTKSCLLTIFSTFQSTFFLAFLLSLLPLPSSVIFSFLCMLDLRAMHLPPQTKEEKHPSTFDIFSPIYISISYSKRNT